MLEGVSRHGDDVCDASCSVFYISCSVFCVSSHGNDGRGGVPRMRNSQYRGTNRSSIRGRSLLQAAGTKLSVRLGSVSLFFLLTGRRFFLLTGRRV